MAQSRSSEEKKVMMMTARNMLVGCCDLYTNYRLLARYAWCNGSGGGRKEGEGGPVLQ